MEEQPNNRFEVVEEISHGDTTTAIEKGLSEVSLESDQKNVKNASKHKEEGNKFFVAADYLQAVDCYTKALELCPEQDDYSYNRAVYFSNRAACYIRLGRPHEAVEDCDSSIELSPKYVKALMRRSQAYEALEKHEEALQDINAVLEIDPTVKPAIESHKRVSKIVHEKQEKMKEEMLGKLKGFGNTILGKFGLSTDNFEMKQDPSTGSYNINFNQNPSAK